MSVLRQKKCAAMKRCCCAKVLDKPDISNNCSRRCVLSGEMSPCWLTPCAAPHANTNSRPRCGARRVPPPWVMAGGACESA